MARPMVVRRADVQRRRDTKGMCLILSIFMCLFIVLSLKAYDKAQEAKVQEIHSMCDTVAYYTHTTVNCNH